MRPAVVYCCAGCAPEDGAVHTTLERRASNSLLDQGSKHRFLGIWRFPDVQARDALLTGIKASGWYGYFDHVNAAGAEGDFARHLGALEEA